MAESAIVARIREAASRFPDRVAVMSRDQRLSFAELEDHAATAAASIANVKENILGLVLPHDAMFVWGLLGAMWAGKTVAVLPASAPSALLRAMAAEAGFQTVLTSSKFAPGLEEAGLKPVALDSLPARPGREIPLQSRAHEAALLLYTSGSRGRPKAVALSDRNILANAEGCREAAGFGDDETMLAILPLFHAYGLTVTLVLPLSLCGTVVLQEWTSPRTVLQTVERHRATTLVAIPGQYRLLAKESRPVDTSSLRRSIAGAERLSPIVAHEFEARFGHSLLQGYGMTEASPVISLNAPRANRTGSVGRPLANLRVTVRELDREMAPGETGEICVAGPSVMLGYFNRPEVTAQAVKQGVLHSGDSGSIDADGYLYVQGRTDDMVKIAGEKVYPSEVENAIEQIGGIEEAAVVAAQEESCGATLWAFVQLKPGASPAERELRAGCQARLCSAKVPRSFVIVDAFPRTATGKADKRALLARTKG